MTRKRYTEESKLEVVKQVTERGHSVVNVTAIFAEIEKEVPN
jgi:transposase-like protein